MKLPPGGLRNVPSAAVAGLLIFFVLLFPLTRQEAPDVWYHLSVGRHLWTTGEFPTMDRFLYTVPDGALFTSHKWLFQATTYPLYLYFRMEGLVAAKCLLIALSFLGLFFGTVTRRSFYPALLFFLVAFASASGRFTIHPEIAGGLILALMWRILSRPLSLSGAMYLGGLQVLWTNLHWSSVLGPALALTFAAAAAGRGLLLPGRPRTAEGTVGHAAGYLLLTLFLGAASLVSPDGSRPLTETMRHAAGGVLWPSLAEIRSSCSLPLQEGSASTRPWLFLALGLGSASFFSRRRRVRLSHLFTFAALGLLSLASERFLFFFALLAIPIVNTNIGPLLEDLPLPGRRWARMVPPLAAAAVLITLSLNKLTGLPYLIPYPKPCEPLSIADSDMLWPHRAAGFVIENNLPGKIFNNSGSGSYLNWALFPRRVFINDSFANTGAWEEYTRLGERPEGWDRFRERWGIETVFLRLRPRISPAGLTAFLLRHRRWKLLFYDGGAAVFLRVDPASGRPAPEPVDLDRELQGAVRSILSGIDGVPGAAIPLWGEMASYRWRQDLARAFRLRGDFYRLAGREDLAATAAVMTRNLEGR